jgi:hypothetical protein
MSNTYKNTPNILYEIFNEPCPTNGYGGPACKGDNWATHVKPYATDVVNTIRDNGDTNIIIIGSRDYSKRVDDPAGDAAWKTFANQKKNLAYSVHYYTAEPGTDHQADLRAICQTALDANLALLVTEFGISEADGGQKNTSTIDTTEANRWFNWLDERQIGWMNWSIVDKNEAASALKGGASNDGTNWTSSLSASGSYIRSKLRFYDASSNVLTVNVDGEGTVTRNFTDATGGVFPYNKTNYSYGSSVVLIAAPAEGYAFDGWNDGNKSERRTVIMRGNQSLTAKFSEGGNLIKNGDFSSNTTENWSMSNPNQAGGAPTGAMLTPLTNNQLTLYFTNTARLGAQLEHSRLLQSGIQFKSGRRYKLSFQARSLQQPRAVSVAVCSRDRSTRYLNNHSVNLNGQAQLQSFEVEFNVITPDGAGQQEGQLEFWFGADSTRWVLTNVRISDVGEAINVSTLPRAPAAKTAWSVVRTGGGLQLNGPDMNGGAKVSLYDVRGRLVKGVSLKSGQILKLNKTVAPAGNYLLVVKNNLGREVYKTRLSLVN